ADASRMCLLPGESGTPMEPEECPVSTPKREADRKNGSELESSGLSGRARALVRRTGGGATTSERAVVLVAASARRLGSARAPAAPPPVASDLRRPTELAERLANVRNRIAAACARSDRDPASVTLVAVTKSVGADVAADLVRLGALDLGENRTESLAG